MFDHVLIYNRKLSDINPLQCGQEYCEPGHTFQAVREYYLLHYVFSGEGVFTSHQQSHTMTAGRLFVIRPGELTRYCASEKNPWHYAWVGFSSEMDWSPILSKDVLYAPGLRHIFFEISRTNQVAGNREFFLCAKIFELLGILDDDSDTKARGFPAYVEQAKGYIEANYMHPVSISDLSAMLNLERSYFSVLFKKHTGLSPQQYLIDCRLKKAAELISLHHYKIEDAALSCGYPDTSNFSKMFKKKFLVSPAKYAQKSKK